MRRPAQGWKPSQPAQTETIPRLGSSHLATTHCVLSTCQTAVDELDQRPLAAPEYLGGEEDGQAASNTAEESVDHGPGHHLPVPLPGDLGPGPAVEGEEAKYEDEGSETDEGDRVARHGQIDSTSPEPSYPGSEHDGPHQGAGPPGQVDHAGASKVVKLTELFQIFLRKYFLLVLRVVEPARLRPGPVGLQYEKSEQRSWTVRDLLPGWGKLCL